MPSNRVALAHDYLVSRGGAERVAMSLANAFPDAPLYTSLYEPSRTFPDFADVNVQPSSLNRHKILRENFRLGLPVLAHTYNSMRSDALVTICSSSGWAHGILATGRKVVYCHTTAHWLYETDQYLGDVTGGRSPGSAGASAQSTAKARARLLAARCAIGFLGPSLRRWDKEAAQTAHRYITQSVRAATAIEETYGIKAEVLPPPAGMRPEGPEQQPDGIEPGYWLQVARLMPYKNVDVAVDAVKAMPGARLVVVGEGPDDGRLRRMGGPVSLVGKVDDAELRWLYRNCKGLVSASHEDFGLTVLEAASFGKPSAVLRAGGFLDSVIEGQTGKFFDLPEPKLVAEALEWLSAHPLPPGTLIEHAQRYGEERFRSRLIEIVEEELEIASRSASEGSRQLDFEHAALN
ncbi:MAG: glycosyltransferase [Acidimicrobiales bacterium]